ncbi:MAG: hypothetical protein NVV63_13630 [Opitutus sp.]|nr:hypothetical protein [Opitutus sp.]
MIVIFGAFSRGTERRRISNPLRTGNSSSASTASIARESSKNNAASTSHAGAPWRMIVLSARSPASSPERTEQDAFARARLARDSSEAVSKSRSDFLEQRQVANPERLQHRRYGHENGDRSQRQIGGSSRAAKRFACDRLPGARRPPPAIRDRHRAV